MLPNCAGCGKPYAAMIDAVGCCGTGFVPESLSISPVTQQEVVGTHREQQGYAKVQDEQGK